MAEKDDIEDNEPEMVVIEEGSNEHKALQERDEDERDESGDDESGTEERLGKSETTEEERQLYGRRREGESDEQYRERRRQERKQKKINRQAAINRNRTELRFLESRNEALERQNIEMQRRLSNVEKGQVQTQALTIDARISQSEQHLQEAKALMAAAVEAQNGEDVVKCQEIIDHLNTQIRGLRGYKDHLAKAAPQRTEEPVEQVERRQVARMQPPKDPKIAKHSQSFQERLDWFDPTGKDPESATVYAIDTALAKDGKYDPRTPKYWNELERRVRAALPHKFEDSDDGYGDDGGDDELDEKPAQKERSVPRIPGAGRSVKGNNTFYLSAERKQAMIEAGVYDDPKLRAKYIKKYREWDQNNAGRK